MGGRGPRRIRFDPHVHTEASHDCSTRLGDVLAAARDVGLDAIAVTDHDGIDESLRAVERAPEYGLTAVPGVEVSTSVGHLLALFVVEAPPPGRSLAETVRTIRDLDGLAVVPHPFQMSRHGIRKRRLAALDGREPDDGERADGDDTAPIDGLEVFNAWTMTGVQNRRARRFAAREGYARIGASDAHTARTVGRAHTVVELPADASDAGTPPSTAIRAGLQSGDTRAAGEGATVAQYVGKYARTIGTRTAAVRARRLFSMDHP